MAPITCSAVRSKAERSILSPTAQSRMASLSPLSAVLNTKVSAPVPPLRSSSPAPPSACHHRHPPFSVSSPAPPISMSSPARRRSACHRRRRPYSVSSLPPPVSVSSPPMPMRTLGLASPVSESFWEEPVRFSILPSLSPAAPLVSGLSSSTSPSAVSGIEGTPVG